MLPASPFLKWLLAFRYPIAFPLAIVEGPIVMVLSGFLVHLGFFDFWPIYLIMVAGDLTGDVVWYFVGRHAARPLLVKYGRFLNITEKNFDRAEMMFHEHQDKILILSKLTTGFGFAIATLVAAGAAKVPFKKYFAINFFGEFIWAGLLFGVGFFFGNFYTLVDKSFRWMFILALIIIVAGAVYGFGRAMRSKFSDEPAQ